MSKLERFEADLNSGCWLWSGAVSGCGYGVVAAKGKTLRAHRFFYEAHVGPIPPDLFVCHKCDTPLCVNPDHLFLGTQKDNTQDALRKGRPMGTKTPVHGERQHSAKLTEEDVRLIRSSGWTQMVCAAYFGVGQNAISKIRRGVTWKHVI